MGMVYGSWYGCSLRSMVFFYQFVNGLVERYPELFGDDRSTPSEHSANFTRKWGSYTSIVSLANDDVTKIEEVVSEPLEKCLLLLAYRQDKDYVEELIHNQILARAQQQ